jgi:hypothetical protein
LESLLRRDRKQFVECPFNSEKSFDWAFCVAIAVVSQIRFDRGMCNAWNKPDVTQIRKFQIVLVVE